MKDIKKMTFEELQKEMDELGNYLYMTRDVGAYDGFNWNGLDYWDAARRHHRISQEVMLHCIKKSKLFK